MRLRRRRPPSVKQPDSGAIVSDWDLRMGVVGGHHQPMAAPADVEGAAQAEPGRIDALGNELAGIRAQRLRILQHLRQRTARAWALQWFVGIHIWIFQYRTCD